ncbi:MAG: hypothetical protein ACRED5_20830 [Propylenella sp.]
MLRKLLQQPWSAVREPVQLPKSLYGFVVSFAPGHQVLVCLLSLAVAALGFVPLELQRRIVDMAIEAKDLSLLFWLAAIYALYMGVNGTLKIAENTWRDWIGQSSVYQLRKRLIGRRRGSANDNGSAGSGRAVAVIDKEVDLVGLFVGAALSEPIAHIGIIASMLIYMLVVEPVVALVSLAFLVPQIILVPILQRSLNVLIRRRISMLRTLGDDIAGSELEGDDWRRHADLSDAIPAMFHAADVLAAPRQARSLSSTELSDGLLDAIFRNRMLFLFIKFVMKAGLNLLTHLAVLSVLTVGGYMVISGQTNVGVVVAFLSGFDRLGEPIRNLVLFYREMEQSRIQYRLIRDWSGHAA